MPKLYELKVFRGRREVTTPARLLVTLDFDQPVLVSDLLRRHLIAVAERDGANRRDAHLFHLNIHEIRNDRPERTAMSSFALPVEA